MAASFAGVGSSTTVDHIEVYKSKDDAFQFLGGTVNASYLVAIDPLDDMFDFESGYTGSINYALGIADPVLADKSQSNGIECDNLMNADATATPITKPVIDHITIIGVPSATAAAITNAPPSGTDRYGRGAHFRRSTRFEVTNSIFMGFMQGISLDGSVSSSGITSNTPCAYYYGWSILDNNLSHGYSTVGCSPFMLEATSTCLTGPGLCALAGGLNFGYANAASANASIRLVNPFVRTPSNFFPQSTGAAFTYGCGAFTYGGADWTAGFAGF